MVRCCAAPSNDWRPFGRPCGALTSASGHRREEGHFVTRLDGGLGAHHLLIHRGAQILRRRQRGPRLAARCEMVAQGASVVAPRAQSLRADFDCKGDPRREFLRARMNAEGGLELFANQSSGVLTSCTWADGLIDNPPGLAIRRGDTVRFLSFGELL